MSDPVWDDARLLLRAARDYLVEQHGEESVRARTPLDLVAAGQRTDLPMASTATTPLSSG